MFGFLKGKNKDIVIGSPAKGKAVPVSQVNDPTFAEEILGKGVAIMPEDGKVCAPAAGEISMVFDTLHAFSMTTNDGVELLVHIGLETVGLKGKGFTAHAKAGDKVEKGDLIITADLDAIKAEGLDTIIPVIVCNTDEYKDVESLTGKDVAVSDDVLKISLK
ncbi:MAG: PTS glucose transporter subunit IIA [Lachnospiraceae bacterium]|nr:PTS glucose transporter subunit IIA [Lachnospiraceae bacterium]